MTGSQLHFLLFAFLDEGICFLAFLLLCVLGLTVFANCFGKLRKKCKSCLQPNESKAKYCSSCGNAFERLDARKFYSDLLQRITNWKKWGWLQVN